MFAAINCASGKDIAGKHFGCENKCSYFRFIHIIEDRNSYWFEMARGFRK